MKKKYAHGCLNNAVLSNLTHVTEMLCTSLEFKISGNKTSIRLSHQNVMTADQTHLEQVKTLNENALRCLGTLTDLQPQTYTSES